MNTFCKETDCPLERGGSRCPKCKKYICTAEAPWKEEHGLPAAHPCASEVGEQEDGWPGGDIITMKCRHCDIQWKEELPQ